MGLVSLVGLAVLSAVFVVLLLVLAIVIGVPIGLWDIYRMQRQLQSMPEWKRRRHWGKLIRFYHAKPQLPHYNDGTPLIVSEHATMVTERIDAALRDNEPFRCRFRSLIFSTGLPSKEEPLQQEGGLVVVHVSGAWRGLFPDFEFLNRRLSGHAMPVRDMVSRFTFLDLPWPVVSFTFPTDAVSALNFGGKDDQLVLSEAFENICEHFSPETRFLFSADCLGGLRLLNWITNNKNINNKNYCDRIAGVVLEGPLPSMDRICRPFASPAVNDLISSLFGFALPNFQPREENGKRLCCLWPAVVAMLEEDGLCGARDLPWVEEAFSKLAAALVVPSGAKSAQGRTITHGYAYRWPPFRQTLLTFAHQLKKNST